MTNCFEMRCPKCGGCDEIDVLAQVWIRLCEDGTDADTSENGDHEFGEDSPVSCGGCGHAGTVKQFTPVEAGGAQ